MAEFEITVRGDVTPTVQHELERLDLEVGAPPVVTVLSGSFDDQDALHQVLRILEDFGLELVELRSEDP